MAFKQGKDYAVDGGTIILITAATVEQTGMRAGATYDFVATGGTALCRWGAGDATIADGGFDFAVPPGVVVSAICQTGDTAINVIEAESGSSATAVLAISRPRPA